MSIEERKTMVWWATAGAAVASAMLLAATGAANRATADALAGSPLIGAAASPAPGPSPAPGVSAAGSR